MMKGVYKWAVMIEDGYKSNKTNFKTGLITKE